MKFPGFTPVIGMKDGSFCGCRVSMLTILHIDGDDQFGKGYFLDLPGPPPIHRMQDHTGIKDQGADPAFVVIQEADRTEAGDEGILPAVIVDSVAWEVGHIAANVGPAILLCECKVQTAKFKEKEDVGFFHFSFFIFRHKGTKTLKYTVVFVS